MAEAAGALPLFHFKRPQAKVNSEAMNRLPGKDELKAATRTAAPEAAEALGTTAPPRRRGMAVLKGLVALLLLAAAVVGWRWMMSTAPTHKPRPPAEKAEPVHVTTVRLTSARPQWKVFGRAVARQRVTIRPATSGTVVAMADGLRDGARVEAGQELLRIDDAAARAALNEAEASLKEAEARKRELAAQLDLERTALKAAEEELRIAEADLERGERLFRTGNLSAQALDQRRQSVIQKRLAAAQRRANVAATEARLAQQEATIERLRWAREKARKTLADTVIVAPVSGRLADVAVERGQYVSSADRLFTIIADGPREISLALSERRYGALKRAGEPLEGRRITVRWSTATGEVAVPARIVRVVPAVAEGKGVVSLHAVIEDAEKAAWLPDGAFVEVRLPGPEARDVAVVPETAVYDNARVFIVQNGRLKPEDIQVVGHLPGHVIVRGLKGGETLVTTRIAEPVPGRKVRILDDGERKS